MERNTIYVGSRASALALNQTYWVIEELKKSFPNITFEVIKIKTIGDQILDKTLNKIGGKGLFVKEIEAALLTEKIDLAVHSMKDVPTQMVKDLKIGAITKREDPRDVLISKEGKTLKELKEGARIGTSSLRRAAQLLNYRPDLKIEPIRGNIQTRMEKIETMDLDGVILAAAGILRMGLSEKITEFIDPLVCTPAVGQGALGIQIRSNDSFIEDIVKTLHHQEVAGAVQAERSFMNTLNGGCHVPIGAYGQVEGEDLNIQTVIASTDGKKVIRFRESCKVEEGILLGEKIAKLSLQKGGDHILKTLEAGE